MGYLIVLAIVYIAINAFLWFRSSQLICAICGYTTLKEFLLLVKDILISIKNGEPPSYEDTSSETIQRNKCLAILGAYTLIHLFLMTSIITWTWFDGSGTAHTLKYISNVWIGIFLYTIMFWLIGEIVTLIRWIILIRKPERDRRNSIKARKARIRIKKEEDGDAVKKIKLPDQVSASLNKIKSLYHKAADKLAIALAPTPEGHRRFMLTRTCFVALMVAIFSIYGVVHAGSIDVKTYNIKSDKMSENDNIKIALVSDMHLGYTIGDKHMKKMVKIINDEDVDLVCVAGDIMDNDYRAIKDPDKVAKTLSKIKSKYGVYGVYGNHDIKEKLVAGFSLYDPPKNKIPKNLDQMMKDANITILQDETAIVGEDIQLIGRIDGEKPNNNVERQTISQLIADLDQEKFIIDIDHEPDQFGPKVVSGVDLDLSGHTHNGQIFPGNILLRSMWSNSYGHKSIGSFNSIVTSGVGVWGPAMRVATNNEVVIINVEFSKEKEANVKKKTNRSNK
ncbi:MAG: metallophosphoesterase [Firmicutes bacterium]|nr:metallophosphoesterase [Bacillota bacterium]